MPTTYAIPNGRTVFDVPIWTGNTAQRNISTNCFADFVWIKDRTAANNNVLFDSVRGSNKQLVSNSTAAELNPTLYGYVSQFNSTNFQLSATAGDYSNVNQASDNYVGWVWQAGQGTTSSNTNGSITSTVSVNTTAGFSVVTYTGTGSLATVGHGLGVAPSMIVVKDRTGAYNWSVYHASLGATKDLYLNTTAAQVTDVGYWNNTEPTSSVFTVNYDWGVNKASDTYVAYCWAEVAGFSKFGSYTGNGSSDGPFIYTGFRPKWIMVKNSSAGGKWVLMDTSRGLYNEMTGSNALYPNTSDAEGTDSANRQMDFLSNGFKLRCTGGDANGSGNTIIYAAFAENPFKYANAR